MKLTGWTLGCGPLQGRQSDIPDSSVFIPVDGLHVNSSKPVMIPYRLITLGEKVRAGLMNLTVITSVCMTYFGGEFILTVMLLMNILTVPAFQGRVSY